MVLETPKHSKTPSQTSQPTTPLKYFTQADPSPPSLSDYNAVKGDISFTFLNNVLKEGYLMKQGVQSSWKQRWFVLYSDKTIAYTKSPLSNVVLQSYTFDDRAILHYGTTHSNDKHVRYRLKLVMTIDKNQLSKKKQKKYSNATIIDRALLLETKQKNEFLSWVQAFTQLKIKVLYQKDAILSLSFFRNMVYSCGIDDPYESKLSKAISALLDIDLRGTNQKTKITTHDVSRWSKTNVQEWIRKIMFTEPKSKIDYTAERFSNIDGRHLISLTKDDITSKLHIQSEYRDRIWDEIQILRTERIFDERLYRTVRKLQAWGKLRAYSTARLLACAKKFYDKENLKKSFLSTDAQHVKDLMKMLPVSKKSQVKNAPNENYKIIVEKELKVKLVITNIRAPITVRKFLSPLATSIPFVKTDYGIFHTGLIIGPWYIDWTDCSLCIPRHMKSGMAFFSADIGHLCILNDNLDEVVDKIADVICEWNAFYTYARTRGEFKGNCQDFIDAILDKLGITPKFKGAMANFLAEMKKKGQAGAFFKPSKEFMEHFGIDKKYSCVHFTSHSDLDFYVHALKKRDAFVEMMYPDEMHLLKSFDRGFWLKHFQTPHIPEHRPHPKMGCPFDNPQMTGSMIRRTDDIII